MTHSYEFLICEQMSLQFTMTIQGFPRGSLREFQCIALVAHAMTLYNIIQFPQTTSISLNNDSLTPHCPVICFGWEDNSKQLFDKERGGNFCPKRVGVYR